MVEYSVDEAIVASKSKLIEWLNLEVLTAFAKFYSTERCSCESVGIGEIDIDGSSAFLVVGGNDRFCLSISHGSFYVGISLNVVSGASC